MQGRLSPPLLPVLEIPTSNQNVILSQQVVRLFVYDLDETFFTKASHLLDLNTIPRQPAIYSPYPLSECYVLNKEKMAAILKKTLEQGHQIGFITASTLRKKIILKFFQIEFDINLDANCIYYNGATNKTICLQLILRHCAFSIKDIYFIDDNMEHVVNARRAGFHAIHVDSDSSFLTNGTDYITQLENILTPKLSEEKSPSLEESPDYCTAQALRLAMQHKIRIKQLTPELPDFIPELLGLMSELDNALRQQKYEEACKFYRKINEAISKDAALRLLDKWNDIVDAYEKKGRHLLKKCFIHNDEIVQDSRTLDDFVADAKKCGQLLPSWQSLNLLKETASELNWLIKQFTIKKNQHKYHYVGEMDKEILINRTQLTNTMLTKVNKLVEEALGLERAFSHLTAISFTELSEDRNNIQQLSITLIQLSPHVFSACFYDLECLTLAFEKDLVIIKQKITQLAPSSTAVIYRSITDLESGLTVTAFLQPQETKEEQTPKNKAHITQAPAVIASAVNEDPPRPRFCVVL